MSLDKNETIAEVGRRTRLRNHDVQKLLEALSEVWSDELAQQGRIEVENFLVLEVKDVDRGEQLGSLLVGGKLRRAPTCRHENDRQTEQLPDEATENRITSGVFQSPSLRCTARPCIAG